MSDSKEHEPYPFMAMFVCGVIGTTIAISSTKSTWLAMLISFLATASPCFVYILNTKSDERPAHYIQSVLGVSWWIFIAAFGAAALLFQLFK